MKNLLWILLIICLCLIPQEGWCPAVGGGIIGNITSMIGQPEISGGTITGNTGYFDNLIVGGVSMGGQYVKLDQSTPQTIINGRPIFEQGLAIDDSTTYFIPSGGDTLKLYLASNLVHTWHVVLGNEFVLLEDGFIALLETNDKIVLE